MEAVTSSDLVRHFGVWRDRALSRPVYVHHHGRAKLVLASVDFMEHLVAGRGAGGGNSGIAELLEVIDAIAIVVDERMTVIGSSPLARRHLARPEWGGPLLSDMLSEALRTILSRAVSSVIEGGTPERLQVRVGARNERRIDVTILPFGRGACILGHDRTAAEAAAAAAARAIAIEQTLELLGDVAALQINLRGYIVDASAAFQRMTGLTPGGYSSVRLPTLFDLPTRVGVGDALERAIDTLQPQSAKARLVSNSGEAVSVCIAFSGEMLRASEDLVIATLRRV